MMSKSKFVSIQFPHVVIYSSKSEEALPCITYLSKNTKTIHQATT